MEAAKDGGLPFFPQVQYIVVGRDARNVFMSLWNHHANITPEFLAMLNSIPDRVGDPMPAAPEDVHEFWRDWISRGWLPWENEGYPYWGNLHHIATWWGYRHLPNIRFVHYGDLLADLGGGDWAHRWIPRHSACRRRAAGKKGGTRSRDRVPCFSRCWG